MFCLNKKKKKILTFNKKCIVILLTTFIYLSTSHDYYFIDICIFKEEKNYQLARDARCLAVCHHEIFHYTYVNDDLFYLGHTEKINEKQLVLFIILRNGEKEKKKKGGINLSMSDALIVDVIADGVASLSLKTLSITESSVPVVSIPQKLAQSLTTIPAAITSLPRLTVPAWKIK